MKIMAVDPGDVRIGLAISDDTGSLARPLTTINHISRPENAARITRLAQDNQCDLIIVGTPLNSDGDVGPRARASLKLIEALRITSSIQVEAWDESGTSKKADQVTMELRVRRKKRSAPKDALAAALILQDYIDAQILEKHATP